MERSFGEESAGDLLAAALSLLEHQVSPPRTAKRTTAIRSPFGFIRYLLFHQVARPKPTTPSGKITTLSQKTEFSLPGERLSGRSSGDFGRIEIRSSSAVSQLTVLR